MTSPVPVGLLTTRTHPLLPYLLDRLDEAPEIAPVLIFDSRQLSPKEFRTFRERTGSAFPARSVQAWRQSCRWTEVEDHDSEACIQFVRSERLGLLVNAGTPRRLGRGLLKTAGTGILNVHPGLLPKYRGANCCEWAIYSDDPVGVTAHFMDEGLDSGPIILTRELAVPGRVGYVEVRAALHRLQLTVCVEVIRLILVQGLRPEALPPQPPGPVFKPMPPALLEVVKDKLAQGTSRAASNAAVGAP